ncbi:hypothetical protein [Vagococcus fluvialis]|uniref:Uncharacterized protein n=1 Tax=Vagococcus fluvialis bH819 TaxID=1255619 RepID=A0A1X6WNY4_9ENTE|nr:hypothetical protein [Vagococcus fluvialis]SLM85989.1 hypothetical protein FM121_07875 [Vagococcus fluvialis bH819]
MLILNWVIMIVMGIITIGSIISMIYMFILLNSLDSFDEPKKKVVYESFVTAFLVVVIIHLIQLVGSFMHFDLSKIISPGMIDGDIIGTNPLHIDSFVFDSFIIGIIYFFKRNKSKR